MQHSEQIDKLAAAIAEAQAEFKPVEKSGYNKFDRYKYSILIDYTNASDDALRKHGFSVITTVDEVIRMEDRTTAKGGVEHIAQARITIRLFHKSGQWIEATSYGEGQDRADKAIYKAVTGARKYGIACLLGLITTDDPEADETVGQSEGTRQQSSRQPSRQPAKTAQAKPFNPDEAREKCLVALGERGLSPSDAAVIHKAWFDQIEVESGNAPDRAAYSTLYHNIKAGAYDEHAAANHKDAA